MTIDERLEALTLSLELTARDLEAHKEETRKRIDALHDFILQFAEQVALFREQTAAWAKDSESWRKDTESWKKANEAWKRETEARIRVLEGGK
jgi:hypothetical protein